MILDWKCGTCGDATIVVWTTGGQPWEVSCGQGHPFEITGADVTIRVAMSEEYVES